MHLLFSLSLLALASASTLLTSRAQSSDIIPGRYIVVMKAGTNDTALKHAMSKSNSTSHVYRHQAFRGFAGKLSQAQLAHLSNHSAVKYIEPDRIITAQAAQFSTQAQSSWGLARISHKDKGTNYGTNYYYDVSAGNGTCVYIIDTGIYTQHPEFEGRASMLKNFIDNGTTDDNGHGTHVAGIVGSKTYGVAKKAKLFGVKVLDASGTGTYSGVIAGVNWAATDAIKARKDGRCVNGTVVNMSLGGGVSQAMNSAVKTAVSSGLFFAVAAGNSNQPANQSSPAGEASACTVAATDNQNFRASFSNYGAAVKVFAPGVNIISTWKNNVTAMASGTSMASPYVAGLAAYFLSLNTVPSASKNGTQLCTYIRSRALSNIVKDQSQSSAGTMLAYNDDGQ